MSIRSMSALALGVVMLLAGCSDAGDADSSGEGDSSDQSSTQPDDQASSQEEASYSTFADFPGEELLYYSSEYQTIGLRIKPVDVQWTTEFLDYTAPAGSHYLVIYVVATGELDDRGMDGAALAQVDYTTELRFNPTTNACLADHQGADPEYCYYNGWQSRIMTTQLEPLASNDWPNYLWLEGSIFGVDLETGQTVAGALAFTIADDVDAAGDFEFCARGKDNTMEDDVFPCIPIPAPDPRG